MPQPFRRAGIDRLAQAEFGCDDVADASLLEARQEHARGRPVLDRIPCDEHSGSKSRMTGGKAIRQIAEFVWILEGRIDQDKAAALLRRQECAQRLPCVALMHRDQAVMREAFAQGSDVRGLQFAAGQTIVWAQQGPRERRGAGIQAQATEPVRHNRSAVGAYHQAIWRFPSATRRCAPPDRNRDRNDRRRHACPARTADPACASARATATPAPHASRSPRNFRHGRRACSSPTRTFHQLRPRLNLWSSSRSRSSTRD